MTDRLLNILNEQLLEELKSNDFKLIEEKKSESFGNELLFFESKDLGFRITRDRGDVSAQVSSEGLENQWIELAEVLRLIDENTVPEPKANKLLKVFLKHHKAIILLLEEDQAEETLEQIRKNRIEANKKFMESRDK